MAQIVERAPNDINRVVIRYQANLIDQLRVARRHASASSASTARVWKVAVLLALIFLPSILVLVGLAILQMVNP